MKQLDIGQNTPSLTFKQKRKLDAQDLAELIYDMFINAELGSDDNSNSEEKL